MSALGQKQTFGLFIAMSALPPKADIGGRQFDVRFVPEADLCTAAKSVLVDQLIGCHKQRLWDGEAERFRGLEVDLEHIFHRRLHRYAARRPGCLLVRPRNGALCRILSEVFQDGSRVFRNGGNRRSGA